MLPEISIRPDTHIPVEVFTGKKGCWRGKSGLDGSRVMIDMEEGTSISIKGPDPDYPENVLVETSWELDGERVTITDISVPLENLLFRAPKQSPSLLAGT